MKTSTEFRQGEYNVFTVVTVGLSPRRGRLHITFERGQDMLLDGKITLKPTDPADNVTARIVTYQINIPSTSPQPDPVSVDGLLVNPIVFDIESGSSVTATVVDANAFGLAPVSEPVTAVATLGTGAVPAKGVIESITFAVKPVLGSSAHRRP